MYKAEHYFESHELSEKEKVKVAIVSFAPDEVDWFRWSHNRKPIVSREDLKSQMFDHLRPTSKGSFGVRLIRIKQEGNYVDYVKKFVNYSAPLLDMAESVLKDAFMNGLEPLVQTEVISRHPIGLKACIRDAQWVNDRNMALKLALGDLGVIGPCKGEAQVGNKGVNHQLRRVTLRRMRTERAIEYDSDQREASVKRLPDCEYQDGWIRGSVFDIMKIFIMAINAK